MKKHVYLLILALCCMCGRLCAAENTEARTAKEVLTEWNTEKDTLDIDRRMRPNTVGIMLNGALTNYVKPGAMGFHFMQPGLELGVFGNWNVARNMDIKAAFEFAFDHHNSTSGDTLYSNWRASILVPVYFCGRWGNARQGYFILQGGPYMQFVFAETHIREKESALPHDKSTFLPDIELHNNHAGLALGALYEMPFGLQVGLELRYGLTDMIRYSRASQSVYQQKMLLMLAYRFK